METTDRFRLPLLVPGQAQKEVTVNEALILVDSLVHPALESAGLASPPEGPFVGQAWLVAGPATGAWTGKEGRIAVWGTAGWRFHDPIEGMVCWLVSGSRRIRYAGGVWTLDWPQAAPPRSIPQADGGAIVDAEARATIALVLQRMREVGLIDP